MKMLVLFLLVFGLTVNAYNVLIIYPMPSISHQTPILVLTEALVSRGHQVFVVSPNPVPGLKNNYTYVDVSFSYKFMTKTNDDSTVDFQEQMTKWSIGKLFAPLSRIAAEQFKSKQFKIFERRVKAERIRFDLVITEAFYTPYGCAMGRHLAGDAPIITAMTMVTDWIGEGDRGSVQHGSFTPFLFDSYTDKMTLWQKIDNWIAQYFVTSTYRQVVEDSAREFFRETYGASSEALVDDCWSNVSLSLISSNFLYFYPRALSPNVIELGPLHIKPQPSEALSQDLKEWLGAAKEGVIYFCLGSNLKSVSLPEVARQNFLTVFKNLAPGYRVLWKWEQEGSIPGQPENVLPQRWFPQQSVLAHPKVRLFITQGGLQSFQEAVHYGVPTIGIPWFADQAANVAKMLDAGIGLRLQPQQLMSFEDVKAAVHAILFDKRYSDSMRKLSSISHDFTGQALDKAVFWVEHVAKHGGASHLRPSTADATLFQYFCLDIISVVLLLTTMFSFFTYSLCKVLISSALSEQILKSKTL